MQIKKVTILSICYLFITLSFIHQSSFRFATPVSRLDLLHAIVQERVLYIDKWHTNTCDKAEYKGHYYSDKAPGTAALALPAFWIGTILVKYFGFDLDSEEGWLITSWAACCFSQALPAAIGGGLLILWLSQFVHYTVAWITIFTLWCGSMPLPYSTWLYSHAQVIGLISIAIWAINLFGESISNLKQVLYVNPSKHRLFIAGFCLALALASEYTAGIIVIGLVIYVVLRRLYGIIPFILGGVLPSLLVPLYSLATIGTPFELPYSYQASFPQMKVGLYAIEWPNAYILALLLGSPQRGLFFWSPFLLMAIMGWIKIAKDFYKSWLWIVYVLPLIQMIVISGRLWDWMAGYTISARYLAPIIPLLVLPCALGLEKYKLVGSLLAGLSILLITMATVTDICLPYHIYNPLREWIFPKWALGIFSYNLLSGITGLPLWIGTIVFFFILITGFALIYNKLEHL